jgi:hypothetical protein
LRPSSVETMRRSIAIASVLVVWAVPAVAADCPVKSRYHADIDRAVREAPSCDAALKIFELCAAKFAAHVDLGDVVAEKCEADADEPSAVDRKPDRRAENACIANERSRATLCAAPSTRSAMPAQQQFGRSSSRS